MRIGPVLIALWVIIGAIAAGQRGYFHGPFSSCSKVGTIAITVAAGPLSYVGVSPKLSCTVPRPTR